MSSNHLLLATLPALAALLAATFLAIWAKDRTQGHAGQWALMFAAAVPGTSIGLAREFVDNPEPFSTAANLFLVAIAFFAVRGANIRYSRHSGDAVLVPILLVTAAASSWYGYIDESVFGRGVTASLGAALILAIGAGRILRMPATGMIDKMLAAVFALGTLALILRPVMTLSYEGSPASDSEVVGSLWSTSLRFLLALGLMALAIVLLLRIHTDRTVRLEKEALEDPLTALANRRGFWLEAQSILRSASASRPAMLVLCDIDNFKHVNDMYGHTAGDHVIRHFAELARGISAAGPLTTGRLGGEEFVLLLADTTIEQAVALAETLRLTFETSADEVIGAIEPLTVSVGITDTSGTEELEHIIGRADRALYEAKEAGRNRTALWTSDGRQFFAATSGATPVLLEASATPLAQSARPPSLLRLTGGTQ